MKNEIKNLSVLIDIRYRDSMNRFEEIYGEGVSYRRLEQDTYVELKNMTLKLLDKKIKFKKCRDLDKYANPMILTVKAEMNENEYNSFFDFYKQNKFTLLYDFIISKVRLLEQNIENNDTDK